MTGIATRWRSSMRARAGFTLMEVLAVLVIVTALMGMALPRMSQNFATIRTQRAATVVASDLRLAYSLAERQRAPVAIVVDADAKLVRVRDRRVATRIYSENRFDASSEYSIQVMTSTRDSLIVFPNGLAQNDLTVTLTSAGVSRTVTMNRAGQVRIQ